MVIIDFFQGLLTPVIAIIVTYIAYQQMRTNQAKLKLDLLELRLEVYDSVNKLFDAERSKGRIDK